MCKVVDIDVVFNRTIELIEYCEQVRKEYGIEKEIAYEVGTQELAKEIEKNGYGIYKK